MPQYHEQKQLNYEIFLGLIAPEGESILQGRHGMVQEMESKHLPHNNMENEEIAHGK